MLSLRTLLLIVLLLPAAAVRADPTTAAMTPQAPAAEANQNFPDFIFSQSDAVNNAMDIRPSSYAEFWKKWHFVAVRWRQDARQLRFVYANDLAWKTLSEHRTDYPDGAMFGKLVYPAEEDMSLPSSVMASNRLDLLEVVLWDPKNKKAAGDGWVYLRFNNPYLKLPATGDGLGVMSDKEIATCVECHSRAYDRADIFSQPLYLFRDPHDQPPPVDAVSVLSDRFAESMKDVAATSAPRITNDLIRSMPEWKDRKLKGYEGNFSTGTLDAMVPVLSKLAQQNPNTIYMVYDRDDPNTIELASGISNKKHDHCAALVHMRGSRHNAIPQKLAEMKRELAEAKAAKHPADAAQAVEVQDLTEDYKPSIALYTICGNEAVSRQVLPLLYQAQDKDGLPSYSFAPAVKQ